MQTFLTCMSYIRLYRVKKEKANLIFLVSAKVCDTVLLEQLIVVLLCELLLPINSSENLSQTNF